MLITNPENPAHRHMLDYVGYLLQQRSGNIFLEMHPELALGLCRRMYFDHRVNTTPELRLFVESALGKKVGGAPGDILVSLEPRKGKIRDCAQSTIILGSFDPLRLQDRDAQTRYPLDVRALLKRGYRIVEQRTINPHRLRVLARLGFPSKEKLSARNESGYYRVVCMEKR